MDIPYTITPRRDTGLYNAKLGIWLFLSSEVMLFGALFSSYVLLRVGAPTWPRGLMNIPLGTLNTALLITSSILIMKGWTNLKLNNYAGWKRCQGLTLLLATIFLCVKGIEYRQKFCHYEVWLNEQGQAAAVAQAPWLKESHALTAAGSLVGHLEGNPFFLNHQKLRQQNVQEISLHVEPPKGWSGPVAEGPVKIALSQVRRLTAYVPAHSTFFAIYYCLTGLHALHVIAGILVIGYLWGPGSRMWRTQPQRFTNRIECTVVYWHFVDFIWLIVFPLFYLF